MSHFVYRPNNALSPASPIAVFAPPQRKYIEAEPRQALERPFCARQCSPAYRIKFTQLLILLDDTSTDDKTVHDAGFNYWLEAIDLLTEGRPVWIFQNQKSGRGKAIDIRSIKCRLLHAQDVYRGGTR